MQDVYENDTEAHAAEREFSRKCRDLENQIRALLVASGEGCVACAITKCGIMVRTSRTGANVIHAKLGKLLTKCVAEPACAGAIAYYGPHTVVFRGRIR